VVLFVCVANGVWQVDVDGRIPSMAQVYPQADLAISDNVYVESQTTAFLAGLNNISGMADTVNSGIIHTRRNGYYRGTAAANLSAGAAIQLQWLRWNADLVGATQIFEFVAQSSESAGTIIRVMRTCAANWLPAGRQMGFVVQVTPGATFLSDLSLNEVSGLTVQEVIR
jgi:hypothetical protein